MSYWREGTTTTRVLIVAILAGALCILALLCILVLGLLGVIPGLGESQPEATGGAVAVPTAAPGVPTIAANANVNIRSG